VQDVAGLRRYGASRFADGNHEHEEIQFIGTVLVAAQTASIEIPSGLLSSDFNLEIHSRAALLPHVFIYFYLSLAGSEPIASVIVTVMEQECTEGRINRTIS